MNAPCEAARIDADELRLVLRRRACTSPAWLHSTSTAEDTRGLLARACALSFLGGLSGRYDHLDVIASTVPLRHPDGRQWACHLTASRIGRDGTLQRPAPEFVALLEWSQRQYPSVRQVAHTTNEAELVALLDGLHRRARAKQAQGFSAAPGALSVLTCADVAAAIARREVTAR